MISIGMKHISPEGWEYWFRLDESKLTGRYKFINNDMYIEMKERHFIFWEKTRWVHESWIGFKDYEESDILKCEVAQ